MEEDLQNKEPLGNRRKTIESEGHFEGREVNSCPNISYNISKGTKFQDYCIDSIGKRLKKTLIC